MLACWPKDPSPYSGARRTRPCEPAPRSGSKALQLHQPNQWPLSFISIKRRKTKHRKNHPKNSIKLVPPPTFFTYPPPNPTCPTFGCRIPLLVSQFTPSAQRSSSPRTLRTTMALGCSGFPWGSPTEKSETLDHRIAHIFQKKH